MPTRFKVVLIALVAALSVVQQQAVPAIQPGKHVKVLKVKKVLVLRDSVAFQRKATWNWQDTMMAKRSPSAFSEKRVRGISYLRWLVEHWKKLHQQTKAKAQNPPYLQAWMCLFRYESAGYGWSVNTGNGYYGGLQMDMDFQRAYGWRLLQKKGTANNWSRLEQIWVAVKAHRSGRGFYPWPKTARFCNLI